MLGSSSTTRRRASGAGRPFGWLPVTAPPVGRADAVVMTTSVTPPASAVLNATCEEPERLSAGGRHGASPAPVPDRVVLRPAQPPAAAQVGPHRPDGGGLRADPGEQVLAGGPLEGGDGVGEQRAPAGGRGAAVQPADLDPGRRGERLLLGGGGHLHHPPAAG